jgi:signal transduction histidine kinase
MNRNDLEKKFLFVGFSEKKYFEKKLEGGSIDFRDKIQKKRIFAGAKGVGRFSCDRLGGKLKLYSKVEKENKIHNIDINWNEFEDQEQEFQTIKVNYSQFDKIKIKNYSIEKFKNGTILEISNLNSIWNRTRLIKLKRRLQRLINPVQMGEKNGFKIVLQAKEFLKEDNQSKKKNKKWDVINGAVENFVFEKFGIKTTEIYCKIDSQAKNIITELRDRDKFIFRIKESNEYTSLRDITIRIFYLNEEAKRTFSTIMGLPPVNFGSIFLYKNGIRIHPYGEEGDDWLGLEKRKGQGQRRYLATREIIGRIEITGYQPGFKEVTSRDGGVVETSEYYDLIEFFKFKVLRRLERFIVEAINWEKITDETEMSERSIKLIRLLAGQIKDPEKNVVFNENLLNIMQAKEIQKLPEYLKNLEKLQKHIKSLELRKNIDEQLKAVRKAAKLLEQEKKKKEEESKKLKEKLKEKDKKIIFLEKINPEAIDVASIIHTIGISTFTINENISYLTRRIEELPPGDILDKLEKIKFQTDKIEARSNMITHADFDMMASTLENVDLVEYISQYLEKVSTPMDGGIKIEVENREVEFISQFKHLELSVVIDNFISNAKKAKAKKLLFKFEKFDNKLKLTISDDGRGIASSVSDKIFNLGYSTTRGSGIGMYHVKKLMPKIKAKVRFLGNNIISGYKGAAFEVMFDG